MTQRVDDGKHDGGWIDRVWRDAEVGASEIAYVQALLEIAARLRAGDFTDAPAASERRPA